MFCICDMCFVNISVEKGTKVEDADSNFYSHFGKMIQ